MIFSFMKKFLDWLSNIANGIRYRLEKRSDNPRGYMFGGPRSSRRLVVGLMVLLLVGIGLTLTIKEGVLTPSANILDRETSIGAKLQPDLAKETGRRDFLQLTPDVLSGIAAVDCEAILANLRLRKMLTEEDRRAFDRSCRQKFGADLSAIIDKIISGEIPAAHVADIVDSLTPDNARDILNALNNDDVRRALRTDAGSTLAKNLATLGKLSPKEIDRAVSLVESTPPQFRDKMMEAVTSVAKLDTPKARAALFSTLEKAKSQEEVNDVRQFAKTIAAARPDEQEVFAVAYERAPDLETRRSLGKAAQEIIQIDEKDPVRAKLVDMVEKTSQLPPERQKRAYDAIGNVAHVYRTTDDPALKRAIGDAILAAESPDDIIALSDTLENIKKAEEAGAIAQELKIAAISGKDPEAKSRVAAAAALVRNGDKELARKVIDGKIPIDEVDAILMGLQRDAEKKASEASPARQPDVSKRDVETAIAEKRGFERRRVDVAKRIASLLGFGVRPDDQSVVNLYTEMADLDKRIVDTSAKIRDMRESLKKRLAELRGKAASEYAAAGVTFPDFDVEIPEDVIAQAAPDERLSNLRDFREFWSFEDSSSQRKTRRYFKFNSGDGLGGDGKAGPSILSNLAEPSNDGWYVMSPGAGLASAGVAGKGFELSRTQIVPGVLRRIPAGGVPSAKAGQQIVLFEFAVSVASRKTGRIEIPQGSVAICKIKEIDEETARLHANCDAVDTGGREDIQVSLSVGDANGIDGVVGKLTDSRGWLLAGIFLTAFSASVLDGFTDQLITPYESKAQKAANDFVVVGAGSGASAILQEVANKQIQDWSKASVFWHGYDGMLATVRQQ